MERVKIDRMKDQIIKYLPYMAVVGLCTLCSTEAFAAFDAASADKGLGSITEFLKGAPLTLINVGGTIWAGWQAAATASMRIPGMIILGIVGSNVLLNVLT